MFRRLVILALMVVLTHNLWAQQLSDSYYRENPSWMDAELWAREGEYNIMPQTLDSPFEQFALYGFSFVAYSFRGEELSSLTSRLGAVDIASPLERYPDYTLLNLLRRVPSRKTSLWSNTHSEWGADERTELFDPSPSLLHPEHLLRTQLSSRTYRLGATFSSLGEFAQGWYYSLMVGGRWGEDSNIAGLFTDNQQLWLSVERVWGAGVTKRLQMAFMLSNSMRSQRSWNTEEVFELSGNRHYNSYWGWQNGKVRSQRVRSECIPTLYASFDIDDSYLLSNLNITALVRAGSRSASRLAWSDAPNPRPDYYGYLPDGIDDENMALLAKDVWLRGDEEYTQIDWQRLYNANLLTPEQVHYALLAERYDILSAKVDSSVALVGVEGMRLGLRLSLHTSHNHNLPIDLLGGSHLAEGFDLYDYTIGEQAWQLYYTYHANNPWGALSLAAEFGGSRSNYLSAQNGYKASEERLSARAVVQWSKQLSSRMTAGAIGRYGCKPPFWENRFGAPKSYMSRNAYAGAIHSVAGQLWARFNIEKLTIHTTLFANINCGESRAESLWNDIRKCNVTLLAGGISTLAAGGELTLHLPIVRSLTATLHTTLATSRYMGDGKCDIVDYHNGKPYAEQLPLRIDGRRATSSPSLATALCLRYYTPRGWTLGCEWVYVAGRYLEPSLYLCTEEVLSRPLTPEVRRELMEQQELGDAHSLGLFVYRRMGDVTLSLSVRNLLNSTSAYYGGYASSRLRVREEKNIIDYQPFAPSFQYIYPRYATLTINYEF